MRRNHSGSLDGRSTAVAISEMWDIFAFLWSSTVVDPVT
jgi:hypothetical protein